MKTKIEGLVLSKVPFKERHLICHLLLRSGRKVSVLFYGGQGGGKKKKSSTIELGYMLSIEVARSRSTFEMLQAKEWTPIWAHEKIRENHKAFYLLCLYLEIIIKIAQDENLHDDNLQSSSEEEGLFMVLSNAIFHMEKRLNLGEFDSWSDFLIFLGKLSIELGVFPMRESCIFCDEDLEKLQEIYLMSDHGGFACNTCTNQMEKDPGQLSISGRDLWELLGVIANHKYKDLEKFRIDQAPIIHNFFEYFCYQFHWQKSMFKSLALVL
ncbi:MAG: hypothetical protein GY909_14235 [Oligoflexia bacterium]|nr:hypothetical protein [Oligoflexia bacterium]